MALSRRASSLLIVLLAALWLGSLGLRPLYKADEGRYGEIPREMVASGDWLTPRLNGFKYFEKPPLQYWATAAAFTLFGVSDWAARLWTGLAALAGVWLAFMAGNRLFGQPAGAFAAAILASTPLYVVLGQINTLDMGVSLFLSAAVFAFALAQREGIEPLSRRRWMLAFWAACAGAVLSKGLIGIVLPVAAVGLYVVVRRDWALVLRLEMLRGGLLFFALTAPWFVAASLDNPEFAYFFFVQEHWLRFTTKMHHRSQPAWYFIPVLIAGTWPWLFAVAAGWVAAFRRPGAAFSPALFLGLWALVVLAFFSVSGSKLPPYILPLVPALAVLAGGFLARRTGNRFLVAQALFAAVGAILLGFAAWWIFTREGDGMRGLGAAFVPWLVAAALVGLAGTGGAALLAARGRPMNAAISLAAGVVGALMVGAAGHPVFAPAYSAASLVASLPQAPSRDAAVFTVETYDHTIPWALRRTVTMVIYKDELAQAIGWEPRAFIPDLPGFALAWKGEREAYAFFAVRDFERLRRELDLPMEIAARGPRYVIVRKPQ
jgi:4-amino-4-deoxy-L-arabinose transferase-like glycosyltransferase